MNAKDAILRTYGGGERFISGYLDGLEDADLLLRPVPGQNHIAWHLGHLLVSERGMLEAVRPGSSPALPEGFEAHHAREGDAPTSDDPARFPSKETYIALRKAQRDATKAVLSDLTDADLDAPGPDRLKHLAPTVGAVMLLIGMHDMIHCGQFVSVRKLLKKPKAF